MSFLIAYMIIGLTFAASLASHERVSVDRWWHYLALTLLVILWPVGIYQSSKTCYRDKVI